MRLAHTNTVLAEMREQLRILVALNVQKTRVLGPEGKKNHSVSVKTLLVEKLAPAVVRVQPETIKEKASRPPLDTYPKIELPAFKGAHPRELLRKCDKFFLLYQVLDDQKVDYVELYLEEEADSWLSESDFVHSFLSGLKKEIKTTVKMFEPTILVTIFKLARLKTLGNHVKEEEDPQFPVTEEDETDKGVELDVPKLLIDDGIDLNDLPIEEGSLHVLYVDNVEQTIFLLGKSESDVNILRPLGIIPSHDDHYIIMVIHDLNIFKMVHLAIFDIKDDGRLKPKLAVPKSSRRNYAITMLKSLIMDIGAQEESQKAEKIPWIIYLTLESVEVHPCVGKLVERQGKSTTNKRIPSSFASASNQVHSGSSSFASASNQVDKGSSSFM
ncbi:OLC1v1035894C1 [Oldenlandia corymbosa var. corymbosa]|uniref:OLC1v1035894C1 n=1 Tax=Oldenlandia corymbosa var. corymbosa TaxID=529605 RepID=A0AAV1CVG4_OLDCO|nr:OLC1v1035894C1 [Oldenlandia corymbosa var. corymbosa]